MTTQTTRRRFVAITPFVGVALLAACSPKAEPPAEPVAATPPPAPAPEPAPAPAPAATAPPESASAAGGSASNLPMLEESDPQAMALNYVHDATKVDTAKHTNYVAGSHCANCQLYQGKSGDASGPCPLFAGKSVAATGWCMSWTKKA